MKLVRIHGYVHQFEDDLAPPSSSDVFFDPADTEVGAWVGADLITPGCTIYDLASGSGAAAAAFVRAGAAHAHGIDLSEPSIAWARAKYGSERPGARVTFAVGDVLGLPSKDLVRSCPGAAIPSVITSNPAYVPLPAAGGVRHPSIDGGPDGLRFVPEIIRHAAELNADLGLTLGGYSSIQCAAELIRSRGYGLESVTLASLPFGPFTRRHPEAILKLEAEGRAALWRRGGGDDQGYLIVGMAWRRQRLTNGSSMTPSELFALVAHACLSRGSDLDALDEFASDASRDLTVRVLVLPDPSTRQHW